jgi:excinuclease ABC subunit A
VCIELLFMPSVFAPCPKCGGARYNAQTLEVLWRGKNIAQVLAMTVEEAARFFEGEAAVMRPLHALARDRAGLPAPGPARDRTVRRRGAAHQARHRTAAAAARRSLYVLDEPTTGLHPADVERLMAQLQTLVEAGNSVVVGRTREARGPPLPTG